MNSTNCLTNPDACIGNSDVCMADALATALIKVRELSRFTEILTTHHGLKMSSGHILCILIDKTSYHPLKVVRINYSERQATFFIDEITKPSLYIDLDDFNFESQFQIPGYYTVSYGLSRLSEKNVSILSFSKPTNNNSGNLSLLKILAPYLHTALNNIYYIEILDQQEKINISARETEVLQWVAKGKTNKEIGIILGLSCFTVKNHMANILSKLDVVNRAQAIDKAFNLGYFN